MAYILAFILIRNSAQGLICSGFAFYIQGVVMKERGPVFVTAFSPLSVVLVMIIGSFVLSETLHMGRCALIFLNMPTKKSPYNIFHNY